MQDLRVFRNGTLVRTWRGALPLVNGKAAIDAEFPIIAGENRFTAYAFNRDNVKNQDAEVVVQGTAPARQKTLYILAIGVNRYQNNEFNLRYAVPDATRLAEALAESQQKIDKNSHVVVARLLDSDASKANILLALQRLLKATPLPESAPRSLAELLPVHPEDSVIVYFAGPYAAETKSAEIGPHRKGHPMHLPRPR